MLSTYSKEQLITYIRNVGIYGKSDLDKILANPNTDKEVFLFLAKYVGDKDKIQKLLASPLLNSDSFYEICRCSLEYTSLFPELLASPYLTAEAYDLILAKKPRDLADLLLQSRFASEKTCMVLLEDRTGYVKLKPDFYMKIINSPFFTGNVLRKNLNGFMEHDEVLEAALKKRVASPELISSICNSCLRYASNFPKSIRFILTYCNCDYEFIKKYAILNENNVDIIVECGAATTEVLKRLIEDCNEKVALKIINSDLITEELMLQIINKNYPRAGYASSDSKEQIYREILNKPNISETTLNAILSKTNSNSIRELIAQHPSTSIDIKVSIYIKKASLDEEDMDEFLSIAGLKEEHAIEVMKKHPSNIVISKTINSRFNSQRFYHAIIECLLESTKGTTVTSRAYTPGIDKSLAFELLSKDLDENNLCYLLSESKDYEIIKKIIQHPSAGLEVCKKANIICDQMDESKRKEIVDIAAELKHKIISETFEIEEEEDVTAILRANVEDGMSTMLWGPSGVGKSSRVFEIDPTATMLILKNGMLPEEVIGGKEPNGEPGKIYPPHWYVVLCEKCRKEPDRKHILFIDEFTNVSDTIKNLVWEIVGNRLVNGREEFPLPDNCSIVVAGNRPMESSAVRIDAMGGVMPAPLHNRIDSMLEIKFDIDEWQKWALETDPKTGRLKIHPIVLSFCVPRADKVMFSQFNPETITQPFLTPRKWEALSEAIYKAEERGENHHLSYARVKSILGDNSICSAFISHYERLPIDMDKIIMGEYSAGDFPTLEDKLYALGIIVARYSGDKETIESFIIECLGDEFLSVYNNMKHEREGILGTTDSNDDFVSGNGGKK